jgi:hypothetical protein
MYRCYFNKVSELVLTLTIRSVVAIVLITVRRRSEGWCSVNGVEAIVTAVDTLELTFFTSLLCCCYRVCY